MLQFSKNLIQMKKHLLYSTVVRYRRLLLLPLDASPVLHENVIHRAICYPALNCLYSLDSLKKKRAKLAQLVGLCLCRGRGSSQSIGWVLCLFFFAVFCCRFRAGRWSDILEKIRFSSRRKSMGFWCHNNKGKDAMPYAKFHHRLRYCITMMRVQLGVGKIRPDICIKLNYLDAS